MKSFGLPGWLSVNLTANARDTGDLGSTSGSGRSLEEEMATHSNVLALKIPWTEETGGLQSIESQRAGHAERLSNNTTTWWPGV